MTALEWYAFVGLPLIILAMAFGAVKLSAWDAKVADRAEQAKPQK
jgi:hypothetical protein